MTASRQSLLIKTAGSASLGFGHIRRSLALAQELRRGPSVETVTLCCEAPAHEACSWLEGFECRFNPADREVAELIGERSVDILVLDELKENRPLCAAVKQIRPATRIIALDHFFYDNEAIDAVISLFNQNTAVPDPRQVMAGAYYEGFEYAIIREEFRQLAAEPKAVREQASNVVVIFGGADTGNNTLNALRMLREAQYTAEVDVILGPFNRSRRDVEDFQREAGFCIRWHERVPDLERFARQADAGIVGGATTMLEFCCAGTPVIAWPQNIEERRFAAAMQTQGAVFLLAGNRQDSDRVRALFADHRQRGALSSAGRRCVDGRGLERISSIILEG